MEFPNLGEHCFEKTCKQLDFLPLKCDACQEVFCKDHVAYNRHNCSSAYKKDVQVPICPLCNTPIPVRKGEKPDAVVGAHMDRDCKPDSTQQKQKIRCFNEIAGIPDDVSGLPTSAKQVPSKMLTSYNQNLKLPHPVDCCRNLVLKTSTLFLYNFCISIFFSVN
ncbi:hypothetical protein JD844_020025 [Phrynosoma platyrhinos]|uniref:AN1-type domain-containing protein n=1 Tax=Phrynosoma platyrhinos TaxID=52577 RepID=A0ABQ7TTJ5_PHRPL|nr:hypothetical protein JD844_020025 [Phrynosoma platyrhinos]